MIIRCHNCGNTFEYFLYDLIDERGFGSGDLKNYVDIWCPFCEKGKSVIVIQLDYDSYED